MPVTDRGLSIALTVSCVVHVIVLAQAMYASRWSGPPLPKPPIRVIYEREAPALREVREVEAQVARAKRETAGLSAPADFREGTQIRIPARPSLLSSRVGGSARIEAGLMPTLGAIVDLGDLVEASGGNPVLMTYFGAIREQIQRTANQRAWVPPQSGQGIIYISFVLRASGGVSDVRVVTERSAASLGLQEASVRIVKTAAPFPPFPPSMEGEQKTIVVPLEFLFGP